MSNSPASLKREIGLAGATMMGLGSIIGTGVFVSIGVAADAAGPAVVLAIAVAALVAACNGLSSASLAANHPQSGGTYEYGYRWLTPSLGFTAGWMFLCAKSASAAAAAIGFGAYALGGRESLIGPLAVGAVLVATALVLAGIRRSNLANTVVVSITLLSLAAFVFAAAPLAWREGRHHLTPFYAPAAAGGSPLAGFLEATALMFVAYTGYGRVATLGEEVCHPRRNIPLAIALALVASMVLYIAVALVSVSAIGADALSGATRRGAAPLQVVAGRLSTPGITLVVSIGAVTAMLGVLLNLILGLSRVVLAMGRRGDLPELFARLSGEGTTPHFAVIAVGVVVAALAFFGNVKTAWSFSAFAVLIYYALTNLAAIRLARHERLFPRFIPWLGLGSCLFLAFWVEPVIWAAGLGLIVAGLAWHGLAKRIWRR